MVLGISMKYGSGRPIDPDKETQAATCPEVGTKPRRPSFLDHRPELDSSTRGPGVVPHPDGILFGWLSSVALDGPQSRLENWVLEDSTPATLFRRDQSP